MSIKFSAKGGAPPSRGRPKPSSTLPNISKDTPNLKLFPVKWILND